MTYVKGETAGIKETVKVTREDIKIIIEKKNGINENMRDASEDSKIIKEQTIDVKRYEIFKRRNRGCKRRYEIFKRTNKRYKRRYERH